MRISQTAVSMLLVSVLAFMAGCGQFTEASGDGDIKIVATYSILGDLVKNVAGGHVEVVTLVGPDGDTHTFEPTPQDAIRIADADVIFENGLGYEVWLDKLYASSESQATRVVVTSGMKLRQGKCSCCAASKPCPESKLVVEYDPHVWHDPANAIHMVEVIRDRLIAIDPAHADVYRANAASYLERLNQLEQWVEETVNRLPKERRHLVTNHETLGYFADRYGFQVVGTALASFSTEANDPSAGTFAALIESVKTAQVRAVFPENIHSPKLMQRLAQETGTQLAPALYTDALGPPSSPGGTYESMVRHNVSTIVTALKP